MYADKEKRILVFRDTQHNYETLPPLKAAIEASRKQQFVVLENDSIDTIHCDSDATAKIIVSKKRTLEAAESYSAMKVCVHNFASATNPGGGVVYGASAQEECICRCSTLYPCLCDDKIYKSFYASHRKMLSSGEMDATYNGDCIYTPDVKVFKTDVSFPEMMNEASWYSVNVITCAAPNLREYPSNAMNPESGRESISLSDSKLKEIHLDRLRRILTIAKAQGNDAVILGAFGCGAFCNSPEAASLAAAQVVSEFIHDFRYIEFAVYCNQYDLRNYDIFKKNLEHIV